MNNHRYLRVTETGKKSAKYLYEIIDAGGEVTSSKNSNREYIAATSNGRFYFGRLDLIGKGDHGRFLKMYNTGLEADKKWFDNINNIAYLENL